MSLVNAIRSDSPIEVEKLLRRPGQYVNAPIKNGRPPLHFAIQENKKRIASVLVTKLMADVNLSDEDDYTPLMIAIDNGNTDLVRWLIDMGAETKGKFPDGRPYEDGTENSEILEMLRRKKKA